MAANRRRRREPPQPPVTSSRGRGAARLTNGWTVQGLTLAVGSAVGALAAVYGLMWGVFSFVAAVNSQDGKNLGFDRRLVSAEETVRKIQNDLAQVQSELKGQVSRSTEVDRRIDGIDERVNRAQLSLVAVTRDLIEVETQFCASDNLNNVTRETDQRIIALLWNKAFSQDFPVSNAYYAKVGRCGRKEPAAVR
jgi:septal ring factor EnvC (AmiA/AmiB activator)